MTLVWGPFAVLWWLTPGDTHLDSAARTAVGPTSLPLAAWGPLLGAVTVNDYRRHRCHVPEAARPG